MVCNRISFFMPDDNFCCEFANALNNEGCFAEAMAKGYHIEIIKASECSQVDFLVAVHRDDIVVVDCTIPEILTQSSVYPLLVAQINIFDHILCFSRNYFPLNVVPRRQFSLEGKNSESGKKLISDWLKKQINEILNIIDTKKDSYYRTELDLTDGMTVIKEVNTMLEKALEYNKLNTENCAKIFISYRNRHHDKVENFVSNIKKYSKSHEESDFCVIPPGKLCFDFEALTPMRRWMLTGLLDDRIRKSVEVWVYGTQDYWESWWTLAELLLVIYFNQTSTDRKITIKYIDVKDNCRVKELPVKLPEKLTDAQIKQFARFLSTTRVDSMGPEAKENVDEKIKWAKALLALKNFKFLGVPVGHFFLNLRLSYLQHIFSRYIPTDIPEKEHKEMLDKTMDMYRNPDKLIEYFNDYIYSNEFWYKLSCQLENITSVYKDVKMKEGIPVEITSKVVDEFLQTPEKECIQLTEQEISNELAITNKIEVGNSITKNTLCTVVKIEQPNYLWLATRLGNVQGTNGLEVLNRFTLKTEKYIPQPVDTSDIKLGKELEVLVEAMAKNVHEVWGATRIEQGWCYGSERNDEKKLHPCLIPYEELPESEKEYDRNTAVETLKLIQKLGFEIRRENIIRTLTKFTVQV